MGEMADFVNDERMDECEYLLHHWSDPFALYEAGVIDEDGFPTQPLRSVDLVPPADPYRRNR